VSNGSAVLSLILEDSLSGLFFECCVAKVLWQNISEVVGLTLCGKGVLAKHLRGG
jgi:hypothetical protein